MTMSPSTESRARLSTLLAGVAGGLVVLLLGAVLIATDVIDTGDTKREVVSQSAIGRPATDATDGGRTVSDIYKKEGRAVVFIEARGVSNDSPFGVPPQEGTATGSGFVVDRDGTILTNDHVVEGASEVSIRFKEDGPAIDAQLKGRDPSTDLAVLEVDPDDVSDVTPMPLGSSKAAEVGDPVVAIGNPFGFTRTVTAGIISAKQRQITAPNGFPIRNVIQTDASINPGNSGGPLLDGQGRVIGINSQIATGGGQGNVGIAFAVPVDTAKQLLPRLKSGDKIERAYLGVEMAAVTEEIAKELKLPVEQGALIQSVVPNGPADDAGLRGGGEDVIVKIEGRAVTSPDDVAGAIASKKPGDTVELEYFRGNDRKTARVELGKRPSQLQSSSEQSPGGGDGLIPLP
jgi:S1-C subfamily serine protease